MIRRERRRVIGGGRHAAAPELDDARPQHDDEGQDRRQPPLKTARCPKSDPLTHDEPQIEAARMDQDAFQDIRVTTQMRATHPAGVVEVRERAFDILAAAAHQAASPSAANPSAIAIHRRLGLRLLRPVASPTGGLRDVRAEAKGVEFHHDPIAGAALGSISDRRQVGARLVTEVNVILQRPLTAADGAATGTDDPLPF